jgi:flavin-dependent dehydrogenase
VTLYEAGAYPRHRVCGEFINGSGASIYHQLLTPSPEYHLAKTVRFFVRDRGSRAFQLPVPGISISRFDLDAELARAFKSAGGDLIEKSRCPAAFDTEGVVRATGRRPDRLARTRLVGLKAHYSNFPLTADLELHFSAGAYIGLSRLPGGAVNLCGLFRFSEPVSNLAREFPRLVLSRLSAPSSKTFQSAKMIESSFCSVAGLSLRPERATHANECRIGDSISMIAPLTGNGMSLAFESVLCAAGVLGNYSKGKMNWGQARKLISQRCDLRFQKRLQCANFLQKCVLHPAGQWLFFSSIRTAPSLFRFFFQQTRC